MSLYLRKKDRIYSQKSTRNIIISMYFLKNLEFRSNQAVIFAIPFDLSGVKISGFRYILHVWR